MAPPEKLSRALKAMRGLGISDAKTKSVLKRLLRLYGGKWDLIEEDSYRTLADAIFESADQQECDKNSTETRDVPDPPLKKQNLGEEKDRASLSIADEGKEMIGQEVAQIQNCVSGESLIQSSKSSIRNRKLPRNADSPPVVTEEKSPVSSKLDMVDIDPASHGSASAHRSVHVAEASGGDVMPKEKPSAVVLVPSNQKNDAVDRKKSLRRKADITNGMEKVKIPLIDEHGIGHVPSFVYIPENTVYQNAYVQFSLARIADDDCCSTCRGDCVSASVPCACARDTGGEFAYTPQGLLKEEFLSYCISMHQVPEKHHLVYCQDCPLERAKNSDMPEPCKGHVLQKFIKECWRKCGCSMQCGNRVVQRGISCRLQVFMTKDKGWGLQTVEDLPKGSFVCEYAGEILTNIELYDRNKRRRKNEKHTYPVLLDADWGSEQILKDEDALCLDATYYGNIARFINHRCFDSNLIAIPVEVETPDHHYYHLAFFTKRNICATEELTWDYGIDFDDDSHPIDAFICLCGSAYCRDVHRKGALGDKVINMPLKRPIASRYIQL